MKSRGHFLLVLSAIPLLQTACRSQSTSQTASLRPQIIIQSWLVGYCPKESRLDWDAIVRRSQVIGSIAGKDSGILADEGTRQIRQLEVEDCDGKGTPVIFRFTLDRAGDADGAELFIKNTTTNQVASFALTRDGEELSEVPRELATDKHGNKLDGGDDIIRTRLGCAECHARVSTDYDMPGANEFWRNARIVARWRLDRAAEQDDTPGTPSPGLPPDVDRIESEIQPGDSPNIGSRNRRTIEEDSMQNRRIEQRPRPRPSEQNRRQRSQVYHL